MERGHAFAQGLEKCRKAARNLYGNMVHDSRFFTFLEPELDIVVWAPMASRISEMSKRSVKMFEEAAARDLHLALFSYPTRLIDYIPESVEVDGHELTCLRSCLMKPEHVEWTDRIWNILSTLSDELQ